MKYIFSVLVACLYLSNAGAVSYSNTTAQVASGGGIDGMEKLQIISTLEKDIAILDTEIAKSEKSKKGWITATVIGSAGVVATGVAAGVQGAQISKKKQTLNQYNQDIEQKNQQLSGMSK